jgi:hypothetical protein
VLPQDGQDRDATAMMTRVGIVNRRAQII